MERYAWPFPGPDTEQAPLRLAIALFRTIAERNHMRARRRFSRAQCLASQGGNVEVWGDDVHPVEP